MAPKATQAFLAVIVTKTTRVRPTRPCLLSSPGVLIRWMKSQSLSITYTHRFGRSISSPRTYVVGEPGPPSVAASASASSSSSSTTAQMRRRAAELPPLLLVLLLSQLLLPVLLRLQKAAKVNMKSPVATWLERSSSYPLWGFFSP